MKDYEKVNKCLLCENNSFNKIYDFGKTPLANEFLKDKNINQDVFDLKLIQCIKCKHVQLDTIVNQDRLYRNYSYVSGTSQVNIEHFKHYANNVMTRFFSHINNSNIPFPSNMASYEDILIDIGSNDGTFLKNFDNKIRRFGIDAAENLAALANEENIFTFEGFFDEKLNVRYTKSGHNLQKYIDDLSVEGRKIKAKVITANHMFAHNKDLGSIVRGVKKILAEDGVFIFENSYLLDVIEKGLFDTIYSEHMHYHHLIPLIPFFDNLDMKIYDVERLPNQHGGSIRVFVCRKTSNLDQTKELIDLINIEKEKLTKETYSLFKSKIANLKNELNTKLKQIKNSGKSIAIYGTPAKATTLMYALDVYESMIDFAVDDAPLKQGTFTPGKHIPVLSSRAIIEKKPDVVLVLAWNFADSIIEKCKAMGYKGKFIIPLPELKIVE